MVVADILTFIMPGKLQELWAGHAGVTITPGLLLVFAILIEIPIAMIFASRILKPGANRWANTVAAVATTAFVVAAGRDSSLRVLRGRTDRRHGADRLDCLDAAEFHSRGVGTFAEYAVAPESSRPQAGRHLVRAGGGLPDVRSSPPFRRCAIRAASSRGRRS